jgi:cytochrome c
MLKTIGLSIAALSASSFAVLLHAAPAAPTGLTIDITSPADRSRLSWNAGAPYAVTVSYDGKSTKYDEIPADAVVLRATSVRDADAPSARNAGPLPEGVARISQSNCMGCHDFAASSAGPSFAAIGKRYAGRSNAVTTLAGHIRNGSSGAWGGGAKPPHPDHSQTQAPAIAQWIVAHGNDASVHYSVGKSGSFRMTAPAKPGPHAGVILSAFYTGPLKPGDAGKAAGRNTVVVFGSGS